MPLCRPTKSFVGVGRCRSRNNMIPDEAQCVGCGIRVDNGYFSGPEKCGVRQIMGLVRVSPGSST